jgi:hypothetical protein
MVIQPSEIVSLTFQIKRLLSDNDTLCPNFLKAMTFSPVLLIFHLLNLSLNDSMMVEALPTG